MWIRRRLFRWLNLFQMMAHLDFTGLDDGFLSRPLSRFDLSSTFSCCERSTDFLRVDFRLLLVCSQWWHVEVGGSSLSPCEGKGLRSTFRFV